MECKDTILALEKAKSAFSGTPSRSSPETEQLFRYLTRDEWKKHHRLPCIHAGMAANEEKACTRSKQPTENEMAF